MVQEAQFCQDKEPLGKRSPVEHVSASQVGYGIVGVAHQGSVRTSVADAVPEIAALPYEQLAVQDSSKTVFGQS